VREQNMFVYNL